jgi:hypothetical protein
MQNKFKNSTHHCYFAGVTSQINQLATSLQSFVIKIVCTMDLSFFLRSLPEGASLILFSRHFAPKNYTQLDKSTLTQKQQGHRRE